MTEHIAMAIVFIILAIAGGLGDRPGPNDLRIAAGPGLPAPR